MSLAAPPWSVDDPDMKLGQHCYAVRDANGQALAYVYFEDEPGRREMPPTQSLKSKARPARCAGPRR